MTAHFLKLTAFILAGSILGLPNDCCAQPTDEIPGAVRLKNGLILRGLCSNSNTIDPLLLNQKLELRKINQQVRSYFVSTRRSDPVAPDNQAVPSHNFRIQQRRKSQRAMDYSIGLHYQDPFQPDGTSFLELNTGRGQTKRLDIGITGINSEYVTVTGLSHKLQYAISMSQIPEPLLYSGVDQPGLLKSARGFEDGETRLNMVQMLLRAQKFGAAKLMISDIANSFPKLKVRCESQIDIWNDAVGQRVLNELALLRDTGKTDAAARYIRAWPEDQLDAVIRVRAMDFADQIEEDSLRITNIRDSMNESIGQVKDKLQRKQAMQIWSVVRRELKPHLLDRFVPYELLSLDETLAPESKLALAYSGWMLGPDKAFDDFSAVFGLYQIRFLLSDYLQLADSESAERNRTLESIRGQEGFSVERVADLIKFLPPDDSLKLNKVAQTPTLRRIEASSTTAGCTVQLPAEYTETRRYPVIVAFSRGGVKTNETLHWWGQQADRHGYILIVPELYSETEGAYGASAQQHSQFLNLLRKLKASLSVNDDRVFIVGHGIGGEAAMDIGTAHPDQFAGIVSMGGLGRRHIQWTAHNSTTVAWYIVVGTRQPFYYSRMELLLRKLFQRVSASREYCDVLLARYPERGFEPFADELENLFKWMNLQRRTVSPAVIDAAIVHSTSLDWSWLCLNSIPERFASMDSSSTHEDRPARHAKVSAKITGNLIRISTMPSDGFLRICPEMPGVDLKKPLVVRFGSKSLKVDYQPSTRDLLEDFRLHRDRSRLCLMKIHFSR